MPILQYMKVYRHYIQNENLDEYEQKPAFFDSKGYAFLEIHKGVNGLK